MLAKIVVKFRPDVENPEDRKTVRDLRDYPKATNVVTGKYWEIDLGNADYTTAYREVKELCEQVFARPMVEQYMFWLERTKKGLTLKYKPTSWFMANGTEWKAAKE